MKKIIILWMSVILAGIVSCGDETTEPHRPQTAWLVTEKLYVGEEATISGAFGVDPTLLELTVNGQIWPYTVIDKDNISFIVPDMMDKYESICNINIILTAKNNDAKLIIMNNPESATYKRIQKGWFYQSRIKNLFSNNFSITSDTTLWLVGNGKIYRSIDSGWTWQVIQGKGDYYAAVDGGSFIDRVTGWLYDKTGKNILYLRNSKLDIFNPGQDNTGNRGNVTCVWPDAYNSGVIVYSGGLILDVVDFTAKAGTITKLYDNSNQNVQLTHLSAINKNEFVVAGNFAGNFILYKSNSEYPKEYNIPESVSQIQLLKNHTLYFCGNTDNFYRIKWPFQLEKLTQKASKFYFKDENIGYAIFNQKIYKSIDGAKTWTVEFSIDEGLVPMHICGNEGHVWVVLDQTTKDIWSDKIILKYTPDK